MSKPVRWGILGTGRIAGEFAEGLSHVPDAELVAVGSRSQATADHFANSFDIPRRHATYEALAADPEVDVIYVSTPHSLHKVNTVLCLDAGKAVLCEKPFTINAAEADEAIALARRKKLFLMEGMWTRFFPAVERVRELIRGGALGEIRMFQCSFGFRSDWNETGRLLDPALGGGALLDVGVYPIAFASMVFGGPPARMTGFAHLGATGVDEESAWVFQYGSGALAWMASAVRTETFHDAWIMGTEGRLRVHAPFWRPNRLTLLRENRDEEVFDLPYAGNGFNYEASAVMRCLREGRTECPVMPLDETLQIARTMDELRRQWGLVYPMERDS